MKTTIWALAFAVSGVGAAAAQEGDFRKDFERRMRGLEEQFRQGREKLEREFKERMQPRRPEGEGRLEDLVRKLTERVERLEKRLQEQAPRAFGEFRRLLPKDFERRLPRFEDREFRFDFRRKDGDEEPRRRGF